MNNSTTMPSSCSSTSRSRRAVTFSGTARIVLIPTASEMSETEIGSSFFSDQEFNEMQNETVKTIRAMRRSRSGKPLDEHKYCVRGLERLSDPAALERHRTNRSDVINAVLDEQDRQWAAAAGSSDAMLPTYEEDEERIARASRIRSEWARDVARTTAASDAAWVRSALPGSHRRVIVRSGSRPLLPAVTRRTLASVLSRAHEVSSEAGRSPAGTGSSAPPTTPLHPSRGGNTANVPSRGNNNNNNAAPSLMMMPAPPQRSSLMLQSMRQKSTTTGTTTTGNARAGSPSALASMLSRC